MTAEPRFDHYDWPGGRETMLRFGPAGRSTVVVSPPLFEEANRTRATIVAVLRLLAARGMGSALPDLPAQGESEAPLSGVRLATWRDAFAAAVARAGPQALIWSVRGGALVDSGPGTARVHLSPIAGKSLVSDLLRARRATALAAGEQLVADDIDPEGPPLLLSGNLIDRPLLRDLTAALPSVADRTLTLFPSAASADRVLAPDLPPDAAKDLPRFRAPWLSSEPSVDMGLVAALADDLTDWAHRCAG